MKSSRKDKTIRFLYGLLFIVVWLAIAYYIIGFTTDIYKSGSAIPNGQQIVPYNNHGEVVYITLTQEIFKRLYEGGIIILFTGYIVLGGVLQSVYKVKIFNTDIPWINSRNAKNASLPDSKK